MLKMQTFEVLGLYFRLVLQKVERYVWRFKLFSTSLSLSLFLSFFLSLFPLPRFHFRMNRILWYSLSLSHIL